MEQLSTWLTVLGFEVGALLDQLYRRKSLFVFEFGPFQAASAKAEMRSRFQPLLTGRDILQIIFFAAMCDGLELDLVSS